MTGFGVQLHRIGCSTSPDSVFSFGRIRRSRSPGLRSTTGERPVDRFERDEREALGPLASRPYRRLGVHRGAEPVRRRVPETVEVERRSLRVYAEAAR